MNRAKFFDAVRNDPFPGKLAQSQVDGLTHILDEWERRALTDPRWLAYMLATAHHETAHTFQPIEEYGRGHGHPYGVPDPVTHQTYFGRGLVQLTWLANYRSAGTLVHQDLVNHPELALQPDIAVKIMFDGMISGLFTGKKLADYFNGPLNKPVAARQIINGHDKDVEIWTIYKRFLGAITAANAAAVK